MSSSGATGTAESRVATTTAVAIGGGGSSRSTSSSATPRSSLALHTRLPPSTGTAVRQRSSAPATRSAPTATPTAPPCVATAINRALMPSKRLKPTLMSDSSPPPLRPQHTPVQAPSKPKDAPPAPRVTAAGSATRLASSGPQPNSRMRNSSRLALCPSSGCTTLKGASAAAVAITAERTDLGSSPSVAARDDPASHLNNALPPSAQQLPPAKMATATATASTATPVAPTIEDLDELIRVSSAGAAVAAAAASQPPVQPPSSSAYAATSVTSPSSFNLLSCSAMSSAPGTSPRGLIADLKAVLHSPPSVQQTLPPQWQLQELHLLSGTYHLPTVLPSRNSHVSAPRESCANILSTNTLSTSLESGGGGGGGARGVGDGEEEKAISRSAPSAMDPPAEARAAVGGSSSSSGRQCRHDGAPLPRRRHHAVDGTSDNLSLNGLATAAVPISGTASLDLSLDSRSGGSSTTTGAGALPSCLAGSGHTPFSHLVPSAGATPPLLLLPSQGSLLIGKDRSVSVQSSGDEASTSEGARASHHSHTTAGATAKATHRSPTHVPTPPGRIDLARAPLMPRHQQPQPQQLQNLRGLPPLPCFVLPINDSPPQQQPPQPTSPDAQVRRPRGGRSQQQQQQLEASTSAPEATPATIATAAAAAAAAGCSGQQAGRVSPASRGSVLRRSNVVSGHRYGGCLDDDELVLPPNTAASAASTSKAAELSLSVSSGKAAADASSCSTSTSSPLHPHPHPQQQQPQPQQGRQSHAGSRRALCGRRSLVLSLPSMSTSTSASTTLVDIPHAGPTPAPTAPATAARCPSPRPSASSRVVRQGHGHGHGSRTSDSSASTSTGSTNSGGSGSPRSGGRGSPGAARVVGKHAVQAAPPHSRRATAPPPAKAAEFTEGNSNTEELRATRSPHAAAPRGGTSIVLAAVVASATAAAAVAAKERRGKAVVGVRLLRRSVVLEARAQAQLAALPLAEVSTVSSGHNHNATSAAPITNDAADVCDVTRGPADAPPAAAGPSPHRTERRGLTAKSSTMRLLSPTPPQPQQRVASPHHTELRRTPTSAQLPSSTSPMAAPVAAPCLPPLELPSSTHPSESSPVVTPTVSSSSLGAGGNNVVSGVRCTIAALQLVSPPLPSLLEPGVAAKSSFRRLLEPLTGDGGEGGGGVTAATATATRKLWQQTSVVEAHPRSPGASYAHPSFLVPPPLPPPASPRSPHASGAAREYVRAASGDVVGAEPDGKDEVVALMSEAPPSAGAPAVCGDTQLINAPAAEAPRRSSLAAGDREARELRSATAVHHSGGSADGPQSEVQVRLPAVLGVVSPLTTSDLPLTQTPPSPVSKEDAATALAATTRTTGSGMRTGAAMTPASTGMSLTLGEAMSLPWQVTPDRVQRGFSVGQPVDETTRLCKSDSGSAVMPLPLTLGQLPQSPDAGGTFTSDATAPTVPLPVDGVSASERERRLQRGRRPRQSCSGAKDSARGEASTGTETSSSVEGQKASEVDTYSPPHYALSVPATRGTQPTAAAAALCARLLSCAPTILPSPSPSSSSAVSGSEVASYEYSTSATPPHADLAEPCDVECEYPVMTVSGASYGGRPSPFMATFAVSPLMPRNAQDAFPSGGIGCCGGSGSLSGTTPTAAAAAVAVLVMTGTASPYQLAVNGGARGSLSAPGGQQASLEAPHGLQPQPFVPPPQHNTVPCPATSTAAPTPHSGLPPVSVQLPGFGGLASSPMHHAEPHPQSQEPRHISPDRHPPSPAQSKPREQQQHLPQHRRPHVQHRGVLSPLPFLCAAVPAFNSDEDRSSARSRSPGMLDDAEAQLGSSANHGPHRRLHGHRRSPSPHGQPQQQQQQHAQHPQGAAPQTAAGGYYQRRGSNTAETQRPDRAGAAAAAKLVPYESPKALSLSGAISVPSQAQTPPGPRPALPLALASTAASTLEVPYMPTLNNSTVPAISVGGSTPHPSRTAAGDCGGDGDADGRLASCVTSVCATCTSNAGADTIVSSTDTCVFHSCAASTHVCAAGRRGCSRSVGATVPPVVSTAGLHATTSETHTSECGAASAAVLSGGFRTIGEGSGSVGDDTNGPVSPRQSTASRAGHSIDASTDGGRESSTMRVSLCHVRSKLTRSKLTQRARRTAGGERRMRSTASAAGATTAMDDELDKADLDDLLMADGGGAEYGAHRGAWHGCNNSLSLLTPARAEGPDAALDGAEGRQTPPSQPHAQPQQQTHMEPCTGLRLPSPPCGPMPAGATVRRQWVSPIRSGSGCAGSGKENAAAAVTATAESDPENPLGAAVVAGGPPAATVCYRRSALYTFLARDVAMYSSSSNPSTEEDSGGAVSGVSVVSVRGRTPQQRHLSVLPTLQKVLVAPPNPEAQGAMGSSQHAGGGGSGGGGTPQGSDCSAHSDTDRPRTHTRTMGPPSVTHSYLDGAAAAPRTVGRGMERTTSAVGLLEVTQQQQQQQNASAAAAAASSPPVLLRALRTSSSLLTTAAGGSSDTAAATTSGSIRSASLGDSHGICAASLASRRWSSSLSPRLDGGAAASTESSTDAAGLVQPGTAACATLAPLPGAAREAAAGGAQHPRSRGEDEDVDPVPLPAAATPLAAWSAGSSITDRPAPARPFGFTSVLTRAASWMPPTPSATGTPGRLATPPAQPPPPQQQQQQPAGPPLLPVMSGSEIEQLRLEACFAASAAAAAAMQAARRHTPSFANFPRGSECGEGAPLGMVVARGWASARERQTSYRAGAAAGGEWGELDADDAASVLRQWQRRCSSPQSSGRQSTRSSSGVVHSAATSRSHRHRRYPWSRLSFFLSSMHGVGHHHNPHPQQHPQQQRQHPSRSSGGGAARVYGRLREHRGGGNRHQHQRTHSRDRGASSSGGVCSDMDSETDVLMRQSRLEGSEPRPWSSALPSHAQVAAAAGPVGLGAAGEGGRKSLFVFPSIAELMESDSEEDSDGGAHLADTDEHRDNDQHHPHRVPSGAAGGEGALLRGVQPQPVAMLRVHAGFPPGAGLSAARRGSGASSSHADGTVNSARHPPPPIFMSAASLLPRRGEADRAVGEEAGSSSTGPNPFASSSPPPPQLRRPRRRSLGEVGSTDAGGVLYAFDSANASVVGCGRLSGDGAVPPNDSAEAPQSADTVPTPGPPTTTTRRRSTSFRVPLEVAQQQQQQGSMQSRVAMPLATSPASALATTAAPCLMALPGTAMGPHSTSPLDPEVELHHTAQSPAAAPTPMPGTRAGPLTEDAPLLPGVEVETGAQVVRRRSLGAAVPRLHTVPSVLRVNASAATTSTSSARANSVSVTDDSVFGGSLVSVPMVETPSPAVMESVASAATIAAERYLGAQPYTSALTRTTVNQQHANQLHHQQQLLHPRRVGSSESLMSGSLRFSPPELRGGLARGGAGGVHADEQEARDVAEALRGFTLHEIWNSAHNSTSSAAADAHASDTGELLSGPTSPIHNAVAHRRRSSGGAAGGMTSVAGGGGGSSIGNSPSVAGPSILVPSTLLPRHPGSGGGGGAAAGVSAASGAWLSGSAAAPAVVLSSGAGVGSLAPSSCFSSLPSPAAVPWAPLELIGSGGLTSPMSSVGGVGAGGTGGPRRSSRHGRGFFSQEEEESAVERERRTTQQQHQHQHQQQPSSQHPQQRQRVSFFVRALNEAAGYDGGDGAGPVTSFHASPRAARLWRTGPGVSPALSSSVSPTVVSPMQVPLPCYTSPSPPVQVRADTHRSSEEMHRDLCGHHAPHPRTPQQRPGLLAGGAAAAAAVAGAASGSSSSSGSACAARDSLGPRRLGLVRARDAERQPSPQQQQQRGYRGGEANPRYPTSASAAPGAVAMTPSAAPLTPATGGDAEDALRSTPHEASFPRRQRLHEDEGTGEVVGGGGRAAAAAPAAVMPVLTEGAAALRPRSAKDTRVLPSSAGALAELDVMAVCPLRHSHVVHRESASIRSCGLRGAGTYDWAGSVLGSGMTLGSASLLSSSAESELD